MSGDLFGSCINGNPCPKTCLPPGYKDVTYPQFGNTFPPFTTNSFTTTLRARSDQSLQIGEKRKPQKMRKGELLKSDKTSSNALSEQGPKRSTKSKNKS